MGPASVEEIKPHVEARKITQSTLVWKDGMDNWKPLKETELDFLLSTERRKGSESTDVSVKLRHRGSDSTPRIRRDTRRTTHQPLIGSSIGSTEDHAKHTGNIVGPSIAESPEPRAQSTIGSSLVDVMESVGSSRRRMKSGHMHSSSEIRTQHPIRTRSRARLNLSQDLKMVVVRSSTPGAPPPPPSILSCFFDGRGLIEAITKSAEYEVCLFLPAMCLAIEGTPVWFKNHQQKALKALQQRVEASPRIAQSMLLVLDSKSIKDRHLFVHVEQSLALARDLGFLAWENFPLNEVVDKRSRRKIRKGVEIDLKSNRAFHPFMPNVLMTKLQVEAVFKTNSKPVLISVVPEGRTRKPPVKLIMKQGDDFRQDVACMQVFRLFNHIWRQAKLKHGSTPVRCHEYYTVATGVNLGAIEYCENCTPLAEMHKLTFNDEQIEKLVATGAGSYIAAYVLGVRDRHAENIMLRADGVMFHIDFGRAFGDAVLLDASSFAITKGFRDSIGHDRYKYFAETCIKCFKELRQPHILPLLFDLVPMMFSALHHKDKVQNFLERTLMLKKDEETALARMRKKIESAPDSYRTYFKNTMHKLAQASKGAQ